MTLVDLALHIKKKQEKFLLNPVLYLKEIKHIAEERLRKPKVYVFGSYVTGNMKVNSDIDVLIVSQDVNHENQVEIMAAVNKAFDYVHPFETHVVTPDVFDGWYKKFIKDNIREVE